METAYTLQGQGETLVLIHGLGLTRQSTWQAIAPVLAQEYRVLSYDLPGHGESPLPDRPPTLSSLTEQLKNLLDHLKIEKAVLVGFSLGGMINRSFALKYPARVQGLVILNSPHERGDAQQKFAEEQVSLGAPADMIERILLRWFSKEFIEYQKDAVDQIRAVVLANDTENYIAHRRVLVHGVKELICPQPPITQPALIITGENDSGSTPEMSRAMAAENPNSSVHIVPKLKHFGLLEQPEIFTTAILEFMNRRVQSR